MKKEKAELIQEALDTLQAVTLSGRSTEGYVAELFEDIRNLEEENKKLNEFKEKREESMFYFKAQMERAEPKTAREAKDLQRAKEIFEKLYREELSCLEEENKKLKEELGKAHTAYRAIRRTIQYLMNGYV